MAFLRHILVYTVLPLLVFALVFSYFRFIHMRDYLVGYEAPCDPIQESCYVYCEDSTCEEPEYYLFVERLASAVHAQCGEDVTDCEAAGRCLPGEESCMVTFCEPEAEACDTVMSEPPILEQEAGSTQEEDSSS